MDLIESVLSSMYYVAAKALRFEHDETKLTKRFPLLLFPTFHYFQFCHDLHYPLFETCHIS